MIGILEMVAEAQAALDELNAKSSALRDLDDKRPHAPLVRWDGTQWVMSVFDPHMFPRMRCSDSWSEALGFAWTWAHINRGAGLL